MIITQYVIHRGKAKRVCDLSPSSTHKVEVKCPECLNIRLSLLRVIKRRNNYSCHQCTLRKTRKPILAGSRFGKLLVLGASKRRGHSICQCDCGNISEADNYSLRIGTTNSCGCLRHHNRFHHLLKGKDHPNWKGGISNHRERVMQTKDYKMWRTAVFQRDNYTCQRCQQVGYKLTAHHIESYAEHEDKRFVVDNGITLCHECHLMVHKKYGKVKTNREQLLERNENESTIRHQTQSTHQKPW